MRIANVVRRFAFEEWGGTETVVWNTAQCLARQGIDTEILCTSALSRVCGENIKGVEINRFPYFYPYFPLSRQNRAKLDKKGGNPYSPGLYKYLKNNKFDIIHSHTMGRLANLARMAAAKQNVPYVVSFHGGCYDVPEQEMTEMLKPLRHSFSYGRLIDMFVRTDRFLEDAGGIICVGYNEYELTREKFPGKLVEYIPNGVNIDKFNIQVPIDFCKKHSIPLDAAVILCVSRIDYQKNQKLLIEMLKELKAGGESAHLVLIGPVTAPGYRNELKTLVEKYELEECVTIIEGLDPDSEELVAAYQAADVFMLPSLHEPFGIVVLEAWSAGLPVIAADTGGLKTLVDSGRTGLLFDSKSVDAALNAYFKLMGDSELRGRMRENAACEVREKYSWNTITEKLINFYCKVIYEHDKK